MAQVPSFFNGIFALLPASVMLCFALQQCSPSNNVLQVLSRHDEQQRRLQQVTSLLLISIIHSSSSSLPLSPPFLTSPAAERRSSRHRAASARGSGGGGGAGVGHARGGGREAPRGAAATGVLEAVGQGRRQACCSAAQHSGGCRNDAIVDSTCRFLLLLRRIQCRVPVPRSSFLLLTLLLHPLSSPRRTWLQRSWISRACLCR